MLSTLTTTTLSLLLTLTSAISVSYDNGYDDPSRNLAVTSCSDGINGLTTKHGWTTQSQIPNSPHLAGWSQIGGWNSANCGTCLAVSYAGKTITVLAIDRTDYGVNMAQAAMDELTGGQAVMLGRVEADVKVVGPELCGLGSKKRSEKGYLA